MTTSTRPRACFLRRLGWLGAALASACDASAITQSPGGDAAVSDAPALPDEIDAAPPVGDPVDAGPPDAPPAPTRDVSVTAFSGARIYFGSGGQREIEGHADFPPNGPWKKVTMRLELSCPQQGCDPWDRVGAIGLVDGAGEDLRALELARFATPYGVGGTWTYDVTDLQPLLAGSRTMRAYIDTWVDSGWVVTVRFDFRAGTPARTPVRVIPMSWKNRERLDRDHVVYGDPARSIPSQLAPEPVTLPASGFSQAEMFVITTGHGQGNAANCAEFCAREHSVLVDGTAHKRTIWRNDCAQNPINNQNGTWQYDRAGWCPGSDVRPWIADFGDDLAPGSSHTFGYDVQAYVNTCRPDSPTCTGCVFGTPCAYDQGSHTEPYYLISAYLVLFE